MRPFHVHWTAIDRDHSHKAIIAYLGVINAPKTAEAFRTEANIPANFDDATKKKYEGLLEKKWTSVVRLQKKVNILPLRDDNT